MAIKSVKELVDQANSEVTTLNCHDAMQRQSEGYAIIIDIRDIRELDREGRIKDAIHAPRGMLEFWFDPASPYHKEIFADASKDYVLFCAAGWRSALAAKTLKDMGFTNIAHIDGGFGALKEVAEIIGKPEKA